MTSTSTGNLTPSIQIAKSVQSDLDYNKEEIEKITKDDMASKISEVFSNEMNRVPSPRNTEDNKKVLEHMHRVCAEKLPVIEQEAISNPKNPNVRFRFTLRNIQERSLQKIHNQNHNIASPVKNLSARYFRKFSSKGRSNFDRRKNQSADQFNPILHRTNFSHEPLLIAPRAPRQVESFSSEGSVIDDPNDMRSVFGKGSDENQPSMTSDRVMVFDKEKILSKENKPFFDAFREYAANSTWNETYKTFEKELDNTEAIVNSFTNTNHNLLINLRININTLFEMDALCQLILEEGSRDDSWSGRIMRNLQKFLYHFGYKSKAEQIHNRCQKLIKQLDGSEEKQIRLSTLTTMITKIQEQINLLRSSKKPSESLEHSLKSYKGLMDNWVKEKAELEKGLKQLEEDRKKNIAPSFLRVIVGLMCLKAKNEPEVFRLHTPSKPSRYLLIANPILAGRECFIIDSYNTIEKKPYNSCNISKNSIICKGTRYVYGSKTEKKEMLFLLEAPPFSATTDDSTSIKTIYKKEGIKGSESIRISIVEPNPNKSNTNPSNNPPSNNPEKSIEEIPMTDDSDNDKGKGKLINTSKTKNKGKEKLSSNKDLINNDGNARFVPFIPSTFVNGAINKSPLNNSKKADDSSEEDDAKSSSGDERDDNLIKIPKTTEVTINKSSSNNSKEANDNTVNNANSSLEDKRNNSTTDLVKIEIVTTNGESQEKSSSNEDLIKEEVAVLPISSTSVEVTNPILVEDELTKSYSTPPSNDSKQKTANATGFPSDDDEWVIPGDEINKYFDEVDEYLYSEERDNPGTGLVKNLSHPASPIPKAKPEQDFEIAKGIEDWFQENDPDFFDKILK